MQRSCFGQITATSSNTYLTLFVTETVSVHRQALPFFALQLCRRLSALRLRPRCQCTVFLFCRSKQIKYFYREYTQSRRHRHHLISVEWQYSNG